MPQKQMKKLLRTVTGSYLIKKFCVSITILVSEVRLILRQCNGQQRFSCSSYVITSFFFCFQYDPFAEHRPQKIADREDEYKKHRRMMIISPERLDPFADGNLFLTFFIPFLRSVVLNCLQPFDFCWHAYKLSFVLNIPFLQRLG